MDDQDEELLGLRASLGLDIQPEAALQTRVMERANAEMQEQERQRSLKQLEKLQRDKGSLRAKLMQLRSRLEKSVGAAGSQKDNSPLVDRILALKDDLKALSQDEDFLLSQLGSRPVSKDPLVLGGETEREKLIRTGKITPFASMVSKDEQMGAAASSSTHAPTENDDLGMEWTDEEEIVNKQDNKADSEDTDEDEGISTGILPSSREDRYVDDGNEPSYQRRLQRWAKERFTKRLAKLRRQGDSFDNEGSFNAEEELFRPSPTHPDINIAPGFNLPGDVHHRLFEYQRTCIKWLWELHCQEVGGILGDEMGLGKTIQVIAFLAGLSHSRKLRGPVLVVCPATVMKQWVQEFHEWWPPLRVAVLHSSGSGMMGGSSSKFTSRTDGKEWYSEEDDDSFSGPQKSTKRVYKSNSAIHKFLSFIVQNGHVVITTYEGLRVHRADLLPIKWTYTVLDEGHKIRNPDAEITMAAKQLKTHNRIILSGTPIQNNLTELWSLYDFVFPGRLGTLPVFQSEFSIPISLGGYANATVVQVQTAYKCATVLRDLISPYLLRRLKSDVASSLPKKSEQVLFCKLTNFQKREYEKFLGSEEVEGILHGKRHALYGIDILRKICNHPDLLKVSDPESVDNYGAPGRSGKMKVVQALLAMWKKQDHKVLLFCQTRQMQDILEKAVAREGYQYLRMDGTTPIKDRSRLVDTFNETPEIFLFLLTTKVGGLGINLTGANRIILYDPDWNPASDVQARERAWRLGQTRDVTIYRLMISGTIEEKIYHRQIFKEFLSKKILQDPRQRRFFKSNDLHDLFRLGNQNEDTTETADLFGESVQVKQSSTADLEDKKGKRKKRRASEMDDLNHVAGLDKIEKFNGDEQEESANRTDTQDEDDRILGSLFSSSGVHSALQHDAIVGSARPEIVIVEREATRVAQEAAAALRASRKKVSRLKDMHLPTWTGKSGAAGAPLARPRFGASKPALGRGADVGLQHVPQENSSSAILDGLKQGSSSIRPGQANPSEIIKDIREFLANSLNNEASSGELVSEFIDRIGPEGIPVFRKMLKEVADFQKDGESQGSWRLKSEFV